MDIILIPLLSIINYIIGIYIWIVIAHVIMSWLANFNVINANNNFIILFRQFLFRFTEPVLSLIRRFLPFIGGMDFSPVALIFILWFSPILKAAKPGLIPVSFSSSLAALNNFFLNSSAILRPSIILATTHHKNFQLKLNNNALEKP